MENKKMLRELPGVDKLLNDSGIKELIAEYGIELVTYVVRETIDTVRKSILNPSSPTPHTSHLVPLIKKTLESISQPSLKPVINATGVILHTNIGRAPFGDKIVDEVSNVIKGYSNIEFNLATGKRGSRGSHLSNLLKYITGAEDSAVVNNNAAAIILILNTLAKDKEVIISRGELIEIGGSFRINEIMQAAGVKMIEVGTTNKTRLSDYENEITENTALIFKAHKSNYAIKGFTDEVSIEELADFAHQKNLPFVYDIGSGLLKKPKGLSLENEPDVKSSLKDGADLICFSGDKLLGGPQAGIIVGRQDYVAKLAKAPLMRALRVGKMTLAALSGVCRAYLKDIPDLPVFAKLQRTPAEVKALAEKLQELIPGSEIVENIGYCGGGTLPELEIPSFAIKLNNVDAEKLFFCLLKLDQPILGILRKGELLIDLLTVEEKDLEYIAKMIRVDFET
ncbi:MAG: L-seryl-tRNA(Sec) selenium transferase [Candidatus Margulisbacteria bacterium]|nr:L-seryl-tRNA(Sec) selenium transferase [Candidatus Margulisiibacteriota bacterium]